MLVGGEGVVLLEVAEVYVVTPDKLVTLHNIFPVGDGKMLNEKGCSWQ